MSDAYYIDGTIDNLDIILADPENHGKLSIGATELRQLAVQFKSIRAENEKLRAALNSIEAHVEGRVIAHRDIAELAESSMSGKKQRVRLSEASDILGKIRAAAAVLKETGE